MSILQPCPSRPLAICGRLFFEGLISESAQPGTDVEVPLGEEALEAFPPGITVEGATPNGRVDRAPLYAPVNTPRCRTSGKKRGVAPSTSPPPVRRHDAPCEAGTRGAGAALRFTAEDSRNPCQLASSAGFRAQPGPQRRGLRPLRDERWGCQSVRHLARHLDAPPPFFGGASVCLHRLDPQRRKSSIISRPVEVGVSWSHWSIFSMTTLRPAWRSTVSCPLNPRALPGRLDFLTLWHTRTPRNASWTDSALRDRRSRRLWGNRNGRPRQ